MSPTEVLLLRPIRESRRDLQRAHQPTRRVVLAGLVALGAAGCTGGPGFPAAPAVPARAAVSAADGGSGGATVLQILAHPDDDLYFMNPDVEQSIAAGDRLVSVYLNCGETGGLNRVPGAKHPPRPDLPGYAGSRRQGLRQAYALMATGSLLSPWKLSAVTLPGGTEIEVDTLAARPDLHLVFLGLRQNAPRPAGGGLGAGLPELWADPAMAVDTLVSTGSPVATSHPVTRERLTDALVHLLDLYRPTLVRTLDPDPDPQVHDARHRVHHDQPGYSDHPDHTATALFTHAALERYRGPGGGGHHVVTAYRGYYNERWPQNLPAALTRRKGDALNAYGGSPDLGCGFAAGCGDYDVGQDRSYGTGWLQRTTLRYPSAAPWFQQGPDGRLTAFGVLGRQAALWQETGRGSGEWTAPRLLGGDGLLPGLTASLTGDGRWQLFAERVCALGPRPAGNRREIVTARQLRQDGPFAAWTSLGNPEQDPNHGRRVGGPVVARNADGTAQLFVRNHLLGVSTRRQRTDGTWTAWTGLHGGQVQDGLAAVTDTQGRIHLFGSGHDTIQHWAQDKPDGTFVALRTGLPGPADPPTALVSPDGSLRLAYREPKTGRPLAYRLADDGTWKDEALGLTGRGFGPLALLPVRDGMLLAARDDAGGTSLATFGPGRTPRWSTLPGPVVGTAALALDATGRAVLARLAPDAALHTALVP